MSSDVVDHLG